MQVVAKHIEVESLAACQLDQDFGMVKYSFEF